jgi:hypothetical protein
MCSSRPGTTTRSTGSAEEPEFTQPLHECVYLHAFETGSELRAGLVSWIGYYCRASQHPSGYVVENGRAF